MSTNIKLLIALLLGAAIGALVMKKTSTPNITETSNIEVKDTTSMKLTTINLQKDTERIPYTDALTMVRNEKVELLQQSKDLYMSDSGTKRAIESWVMDKDDMLALLGVVNYQDSDVAVKGMRCYIGYNNNQTRGAEGYTLVCVPTDQNSSVIKRNNGTPNPLNLPEAIEYHMPCPRNCGVNNHPNDLSSPAAQSRRPK